MKRRRVLILGDLVQFHWATKSYEPKPEKISRPQKFFIARTLVLLSVLLACASSGSILGTPVSGGYRFINFDPNGSSPGISSNANGISNTGQVVGTILNPLGMSNFIGTPGMTTPLNTGINQMALGVNSTGNVVGGNGTTAFFLPHGGSPQTLTVPSNVINAFGINDLGNIVGQFTSGLSTPGFILPSSTSTTFSQINAPSGPDIVNAQGINNHGLVVGFYIGADGQDHGFKLNAPATPGVVTGTAIADPTIPSVLGEPGATFIFSQLLGVNDNGLVAGYYGDSTTSQHGFLYDTKTGMYTFLDDPSEAFDNGQEITQITGINDSGEITGFYTDAAGVAHSFVAFPVPEQDSWFMATFSLGFVGLGYFSLRRRRERNSSLVKLG